MNNLRNSVRLFGNLGMDPETKEFSDRKMAKFSLATSEAYKDKDGNKAVETQWHNLVCWGKPAEIAAKYLKKGSEVAIEGKLTTRQWEDKDGNKRYTTEVLVNELLLTGRKD